MSSPLRSCEEDEGMVVNSEGGDFDEEDDDDGDPDENASDINSPAAPRETATPAAPGTLQKKKGKYWRTTRKRVPPMKNTVAINWVEGQQADCVPPQICAFSGVLAARTGGVRADLPRSLRTPICEKEDTCSISAHLLLGIHEGCQQKTGVSCVDAGFSPLRPPDNKRKV